MKPTVAFDWTIVCVLGVLNLAALGPGLNI